VGGFSVWSAHNYGRIFYGLVEKLIENAIKHSAKRNLCLATLMKKAGKLKQ
jgi:hypothetical protein